MTEDKRLKQLRELGLTISYYRKLKGLTQGQLASLVGLSRTHISNIEAPNIKTSISLDSLLDIADVLGIAVKEDRKSTRLNSSHVSISYAVFCLKNKTET